MLEELAEELKSVKAAIRRLTADPVSSKSVSSANGGGYSSSFVSLPTLYARERDLEHRIAEIVRAQSGAMDKTYAVYEGGAI